MSKKNMAPVFKEYMMRQIVLMPHHKRETGGFTTASFFAIFQSSF